MKSTIGKLMVINIAITVIIAATWILNLYKLIGHDFEAPYKAEVIHAIGVVPPFCVVTAFIDLKDGKPVDNAEK